jgi:hypothetical protein
MSWIATTVFGAVQKKNEDVERWSRPFCEAFCEGCWLLHWTDDTLFWVAKPTVSVERTRTTRRLHNESHAALLSDVENLYFLQGVLVPAFVVVRPEWITLQHISTERNSEVQRLMIERWPGGWKRYLEESGCKVVEHRRNERDQQIESLYRLPDGRQRIVVSDPSTGRKYALGVPREVTSCQDAQSWLSSGLDKRAIHRS